MSLELTSVRVSEHGKDQLIKLKRITGIKQWNVLCRWAICTSLADQTPPLVRDVVTDSNVEMTWRTFAGPNSATLEALIKLRHLTDGDAGQELLATLQSHLHRGIGQLAGTLDRDQSVEGLIRYAAE
jgi:DNA sulfur modification protein DndE